MRDSSAFGTSITHSLRIDRAVTFYSRVWIKMPRIDLRHIL
jgi:hypothetical protein